MSGLPKLLRPSVLLRRRALYAGLLGGNRFWMGVGAVMWLWGKLKGSLFGSADPITRYARELKPGERLIISHPESSKGRKARKKRRKAARNHRD